MKILTLARRSAASAFTLMEMMLVLAIIAVLIAIGAATLGEADETAKITAAQAQINTIRSALLQYKTLNRTVPTQAEGLEALVTPPGSAKIKRKLIEETGITDPWGTKYQYRNPGKKNAQSYDIYSMGPDKKDGSEDDVYP